MTETDATMAERKLRTKRRINYKKLADVTLPRRTKQKTRASQLYPVDVVERDDRNGRVKVHYVGFSSTYDEWKEQSEVVPLSEEGDRRYNMTETTDTVRPFNLYWELGTAIKKALTSGRKIPFDKVQFTGGLMACSTFSRTYRGIQRYTIKRYQDLNPLLGDRWHYRGLNANGDFCYVLLDTLEFYLHQRRPMKEYVPSSDSPTTSNRELGHALILTFVRGDGTPDRFGKDQLIFHS